MSIAVWVEQRNGKFVASVLGNSGVCAEGDTREVAVAALSSRLTQSVASGQLLFIEPQPKGLVALAGRYADDPVSRAMWDEVVAEAYRQRDEQKAQEFPE